MDYKEIARRAGTTTMSVSNVMRGKKTTNKALARIVAKIKGGKPSDYIYVVNSRR